MKTIAITIEEHVLDRIRILEKTEDRSRSDIIREAVRLYLNERERIAEHKREREIFRRNKRKINRQAAALVREQAKI